MPNSIKICDDAVQTDLTQNDPILNQTPQTDLIKEMLQYQSNLNP